ncbi:MAG: thioredoxin domain-containing protein [Opitutaceae bacterium]|nr:thioredoxin domain-containing protein [Opitutaceae bacterium]
MPNHLADSQSPYLRQHAGNPVDWFEWSEEAFEKARKENKPIFLSIGYSTCHWCHVMAHESFENEETAALLNASFVSIKVDREERPDVDRIYMTYVQALTGHGGWPLSAWLTPDLKPFFGGTYFPPEDRSGRPGFPAILREIASGWVDEGTRAKFVAEGARIIDALKEHSVSSLTHSSNANVPAGRDLLESAQESFEGAFRYFYENFDAEHGGFGGAPKFPRASVLTFLFRCTAIQGPGSETGTEAIRMATQTLQGMARGGIHDHVGGGFHRYSVDEGWFVPHFEKMLYDQAQIAGNYLEARQATGDERYGWLARDTLDYLLRDLRHPDGAFFSAEDADSLIAAGRPEHAEGAFYVWTSEQVGAAVGPEEARLLTVHFGMGAEGNVPAELDSHHEFSGRNILAQKQSLSATARLLGTRPEELNQRLQAALEKLRATRLNRPRPHLDDKVITAWNGLAISAFARAHVALERPGATGSENASSTGEFTRYLDAARSAATFIQENLFDANEGILFRTFCRQRGATRGFAEDYAFLIGGLIDLYEACFEIRWLKWAEALQRTQDRLFWDNEHGGYFSAASGDPRLILRTKDDYDGAEPTASSVAATNLLRLAGALHQDELRKRAIEVLEAFRSRWTAHPQTLPQLLTAVEYALASPRHVVIAGTPGSPDFQALAGVLPGPLGPNMNVLAADGAEGQRWLAERAPWISAMHPMEGRATAYVCEDYACREPVSSARELAALIAG